MTRIRGAAVGIALATLAAGAGALSTARAQASGNLQASVTVLDDLVSRAVASEVEAFLRPSTASTGSAEGSPTEIDSLGGVAATLVELEPVGRLRRLRIDIVYLY